MNDIVKIENREIDGFDSVSDDGDEQRLIQGHRVSFTNDATWVIGDDEELPRGREFTVVNLGRLTQKWGKSDGPPIETRILGPEEKFPDVKALNEATPKSEWREGPNGLQGPWANVHIVYMVDLDNAERFTFPTSTVGGSIAVGDLKKSTVWMRRFRGQHVYPVVKLRDIYMSTRFGGRQRPHFEVVRWIALGGENEAGEMAKLTGPREVEEPTAKEVTNDQIPF